jgi:hypothetical protein
MDAEILQLTEELMQTKEKLSKASAEKTKLEDEKKKLEYRLYYAMENNDITSFKHDVHGTIYRSHRVWCKIVDYDKACQFLKERGVFDEVMKLEARAGRLNTLIKTDFLDAKGVIPETEIGISATLTPMIGNRASKKGGDVVQELESEGL